MIHLSRTILWNIPIYKTRIKLQLQYATIFHQTRFFCTNKKDEVKQINVVETEGNIMHATNLVGEAVHKKKEPKVAAGGGGGSTTIHHQHVIYKNKESKVCKHKKEMQKSK